MTRKGTPLKTSVFFFEHISQKMIPVTHFAITGPLICAINAPPFQAMNAPSIQAMNAPQLHGCVEIINIDAPAGVGVPPFDTQLLYILLCGSCYLDV